MSHCNAIRKKKNLHVMLYWVACSLKMVIVEAAINMMDFPIAFYN